MKKICIALFMFVALTVSLSTYAQDNKKENATCCKAKIEQSGEVKDCCAENKPCCDEKKACCNGEAKDCCAENKPCCDEKKACCDGDKKFAETKSCGKKN